MDKEIQEDETSSKEKKGYGDTLITISSPEFVDRLSEMKSADPDITWVDISKKVNDEFNIDLTPNRISDIYKKEVTNEVTVSRVAKKRLDKYLDTVGERFGGIAKTTERYHDIVKKTLNALEECEEAELLEMMEDVFKAGKQVETVHKMGMSQFALIRSEQDRLTLTQKTGMFTDEQVKSHMFKLLPKILTMLETQGKLKIIDKQLIN